MSLLMPISLLPLFDRAPPTPPRRETGFQDLPAEIKVIIVKYLDGDTLTLRHVATCNRQLYLMAMPELYAHVSLGAPPNYRIWPGLAWPADRRSVSLLSSQNFFHFLMLNIQIECFLLTILRSHHIAALVKSLDLTDLHDLCYTHRHIHTHPDREQLIIQPLLSQDHKMIMDAGMSLPLYPTVRAALHRALEPDLPRSDALLAVLLGYLPNLERLEIKMESEDPYSDPPVTEWNLVERVLIGIVGAQPIYMDENDIPSFSTPMLSQLTHLKAEIEGTRPLADIDMLMVLLQIPTLTHAFGTQWTNARRWLRPEFQNADRLIHLELRDCTFDAQCLEKLLNQTNKLETFIYERGWTKEKYWVLKVQDLSKALQYIYKTLTCLELSFNQSGRRIYEDLYLQPVDLSGLVHLKRLRISAGYLVQTEQKISSFQGRYLRLYDQDGVYNSAMPLHELLPQSLEELHIFQIRDGLEFLLMSEKLRESLYSRGLPISSEPPHFQHLKEIIIEAPFEDKGVYFFNALSQITNHVGVKLTTIENSADYVRSWMTGEKRGSCPDKKIDWGFDGEIQWEHPFTQRGELNFDLQ